MAVKLPTAHLYGFVIGLRRPGPFQYLRKEYGEGMDRGIKAAWMVCAALAIAGAGVLASCVSAAPSAAIARTAPLPLSVQGALLTLRADARQLTPHSVNLVVHLVVRAPIADVSVSVTAADPRLAISPPRCDFRVLDPPTVPHATHPPYPLPAIPLCSLVLTAPRGGRYPVTLRVRDAAGRDLVAPIHTVIVIRGS